MSTARDLAPILEDLSIAPERLTTLGSGGPSSPRLAVLDRSDAQLGDLSLLENELGRDDAFLLWLRSDAEIDAKELARLRNRLWPHLHTFALYRATPGGIERRVLQGTTRIAERGELRGTVLAAHARSRVLSPAATVEKFDSNAASWNGDASSPGYSHHRWMRRLVAHFADARQAQRILDFGSGAGWVGIEAALVARSASLHAFDPSPEMIRLAEANARESGVTIFEGRVGFGEDPPFPAPGEAPYDLVYSSGVVSFSPDFEAWLDGLSRTVGAGGTLVVGDLNPASFGTRRRQRSKPLLPVRELNARRRDEVRSGLEKRGFRFEAWAGYQLTWPVPELMHLSASRLGGALDLPLLLGNRCASRLDRWLGSPAQAGFDSWMMRLRRV